MTFDEIKAAALALPDKQRIELLHVLDNSVIDDDELSPEQTADLQERIREFEANPELGEDGDIVMARLRAKYGASGNSRTA